MPAQHSGEEIFRATCATCHGIDGRGSPQSLVGFDTPLPDFTDCAFATAESAADWQSVVHEGGPIRGLDRHMPSFGDALSRNDIASAVRYIKTFCTDRKWPQGDLNFPRAFFTEKAFPENEWVLTTGITPKGEQSVENALEYERRLGSRTQLAVEVPITAVQDADGEAWRRGVGDVEIGVKRTVFSNATSGGIAAVSAIFTLPSGNEAAGFGEGVKVFEPVGLWDQRLGRNWFVQTQAGLKFSSDRARVENGAYFNGALGRSIAADRGFGRLWTPQVEVLWARSSGGSSEWDLVPEMQITLSKIQHVRAAVGARVPVNGRAERHAQVVTYLLWDWGDGGFFQFWK